MRRLSWLLAFLVFLLPVQQASAELIAHYEFNGDTDDSSGNGNDGFEAGDATPVDDGLFGGAYEFGTESAGAVIVPLDVGPSDYPDLTVSMWVKVDPSVVDSPGLFKAFGHDDGGWDRGFGLDNRQGPYRFAAFNGNGITPETATPITEEWTFLAAVWDTEDEVDPLASPATVTFYVGGNSVSQPLVNGLGQVDASIGAVRPDNFAETWRGLIDEVRIFDEALSEEEIDELRFPDALAVAGDANDDGVVNMDDYELIQANIFMADPIGDPRLGDVNLDRVVNFDDFRIWKDALNPLGQAQATNAVPEPNAIGLFAMAFALCLSQRRRRVS